MVVRSGAGGRPTRSSPPVHRGLQRPSSGAGGGRGTAPHLLTLTPTTVSHCPAITPFAAVCLIASYIQQRAGKRAFAKDFPTLLSRAVTRADITSYFAAANDSHISTQDLVEKTIARLDMEHADFELTQGMQEQLNSSCAEVTNRASSVWPTIEALARLYRANQSYKALGGLLKNRFPAWLEDFQRLTLEDTKAFNDGYLYCLMAMIIQNAKSIQHLSAAATGAKSEATE